MTNFITIDKVDVADLERDCLVDGMLQPKDLSYYKRYDAGQLRTFMHKHGLYCLPTTELISFFKSQMNLPAIEIGAGNGCLGRSLGVPLTDNRMQERPEIQNYYRMAGQPPIVYPDDIEGIDAISAVRKYKPLTVVGSFVTHKWEPGMTEGNALGVDYNILMPMIDRLILVGNMHTHKANPMMKKKHEAVFADWIITRGVSQDLNRIFIWGK